MPREFWNPARRRSSLHVERLETRQMLAAAPVINEIMAINATGLSDLDMETSDWIEIHNPDPTPLDLTAWHLTDDEDRLERWTFPAGATVPGNGYLVVFASDKDLTSDLNELHTNFRLNGGGEFLALVTPQLEIAHQYNPFPPQRADFSYGLTDAGPLYFAEPTPGAANGEGFVGFVADTKFDHDRGFYDASETFVLTITSETVGATIYYTTDFTEPAPDNPSAMVFDPQTPIPIITTTIVRAVAVKEGFEPSNVDTQTYIFLSDTIHQPTNPVGFPSTWGSRSTDYEMDPTIVNDPVWGPQLEAAMRTHPTISLVMDNDSWFDRTEGIIANSGQHGDQWERPMSIEFFDYPDGEQIQVNAGIRINGAASRGANRGGKHNFRVVFREEYGPRRLEFPLFDELPQITSFDNFILRGGNGDSFVNPGVYRRAQYIRDQWHRDMQTAMGNPTAAQDYVQLYINGLYWGLYHTIERIDDEFLADHFGGQEEDYDMIKDSVAEEGDKVAWNAMLAIANAGVSTPAAYAEIQEYLDVDSLIDYILINFYSGNDDWGRKNWRAARRREPGAGFIFIVWDSERTDLNALSGGSVNKNVTGTNVTDTPSRIHQRLTANLEYRLRFADRAQKFFFNEGPLSPSGAEELFNARADEIRTSIIAESARWGDLHTATPRTQDDWESYLKREMNTTYFPFRSAIVLGQLNSRGLYPSTDAVEFTVNGDLQHGGQIVQGDAIDMTAPPGTIYFTLDGSDPRLEGGAVNPEASEFTGSPLELNETAIVQARVRTATGEWSALSEALFSIGRLTLAISELHYRPADWPEGTAGDRDDFEFIEVFNYGTVDVELDGVRLVDGVDFDFSGSSVSSLAPGQYGVVVHDLAAFATRYDTDGMTIIGEYLSSGDQLSNSGEKIELVDAFDQTISKFRFKDGWHKLTDGEGFSLTQINPSNADADLSNSAAWRPSSELHGSPGRADSLAAPAPGAIVVNEVLAHSDGVGGGGVGDWIELLNTTNAPINIGGWFISNDRLSPLKYEIPLGTTLSAGGLATFTEQQHFGASFTLSESGDEVVVQAAAGGAPLGFRAREDFDASENGRTFGRFIKTTGGKDFVSMENATFGAANSAPLVGPVVIQELMYNPGPNNGSEFIELMNITDAPVSLAGWHFSAISFTFADDVTIQPGELVVVVPLTPNDFRASHNVPAGARLFGPYLGSLNNAGESLRLNKPGQPEDDGSIPSIMIDRVSYDDKAPWPVEADGTGVALQRKQVDGYSNEPTNWTITLPGGTPGDFAIPPTVVEVFVSGSDWSPAMLDRLGGSGFSIPAGSAQLQTLAWTGLDQISIRFSETVEVTIADLRVAGVNVGDYDVADFNYDDAMLTATWRLGQSIRADKLLIELSGSVNDGVRDESGLPLDGNWTNATSMFPSGNGVIDAEDDNGDAFRFRINVVAGDVTGDGQVNRADLLDLIFAMGDRGESLPRDLTGDGRVDVTDLRAALLRMGGGLPSAEPRRPGSAAPRAAVDAVFERLGAPAPSPQANVVSRSLASDDRPPRRETAAFRRRLGRGISDVRVTTDDDLTAIRTWRGR